MKKSGTPDYISSVHNLDDGQRWRIEWMCKTHLLARLCSDLCRGVPAEIRIEVRCTAPLLPRICFQLSTGVCAEFGGENGEWRRCVSLRLCRIM